jgi:hypothetical protein
MRYSDYNETDKFLDELFAEDAEIGWSCEKPCDGHNAMNITVVKQEGEAELTYIKSLISELSEKLMEISDKAASLPDEKKREAYSITKEDVVSRLISVNNSIDAILLDIEESSVAGNMNASMTIIGGGFPMGSPMF